MIEDGFIISFLGEIPDPDGTGSGISMPGELLSTYVEPINQVKVKETEWVGWD